MSFAIALSFAAIFLLCGYVAGRLHSFVVDVHDLQRHLQKEQAFMSEARDALTTLEADVTQAETIKSGVIALVEGLVAEVQKQAAATADAPTAKELLALATRIQAMTTNYSDAVVANTPAAAPPVTTPDPAPTQPAISSDLAPGTSGDTTSST